MPTLRWILPLLVVLAWAPSAARADAPPAHTSATCDDYSNQADAQRNKDTRDADSDGIYCEALPCPCLKPGSSGGGGGGQPTPAPKPRPKPKPKPRKRAQVISARITSVSDGDTIKVRAFGAKRDFYRLRLIGIDTPETKDPGRPVECGGRRADSHMRELSFTDPQDTNADGLFDADGGKGRRVTLRTDPSQDQFDRYGRLLAYVTTLAGKNLAAEQLSAGVAKVYVFERPFAQLARFRAAQGRAREGRRGVWRLCGGNVHRANLASAAGRRYQGRAVGNSPSGGRVAKHSFPVGAGYGLNFRDNRRSDTRYRVCAWMGGLRRGCENGRSERRGRDDVLQSPLVYNPQDTGLLIWRWYVGGQRVARWEVTVTIGD